MTSAETGQRIHVHHSYIWLGGLRVFFYLLIAVAVSSISSIASVFMEIGDNFDPSETFILVLVLGAIIVSLLVIFGIVVGLRAWSYKHLWYEIGPEEFSLCSGIFSKKRAHVPYQRIQSVDENATLIQRIFGVCSVSIDTAGGANNKAIVVPYVAKGAAETLRRELFERKQWAINGTLEARAQETASHEITAKTPDAPVSKSSNVLDIGDDAWKEIGGVFAGPETNDAHVAFEYGLSNKELVLSGLSNNTSFAVVVLIVFAGLCQIVSSVFDLFPETGDMAVDFAASLALQQGLPIVIGWTVGIIIVAALIGWGISTISACLSYGGFHARRRGDRIEVERGLLQHQSQSVSVERIQSVVVKQTFIRRIIGYCEISLGRVNAHGSNEDNTNNKQATLEQGIVIHPFVKKDKVNEILGGLVPEFSDLPNSPDLQVKIAPVGLRRGIIRQCILQGGGFWLAVFTFVVQFCVYFFGQFATGEDALEYAYFVGFADIAFVVLYILAALLFVLDIVRAILWFRGSSYGINKRFMEVTNSGFSVTRTSFPRTKLQFGYTKTNPFQRLAHTATICARTAAGVGGTTIRLIDISEEDANNWLDWVRPFVISVR